jgi:deoxycitidine kinase/deoxyguanosine kinase
MSHIVISLDGNIGAGKSTLLQKIREQIPEVHVVDEPVNLWTYFVDEHKQNMLELFYNDKKRWGLTFQTCALLTRQKNMQAMLDQLRDSITPQIIITERSILTDKHVFAEMLYRTGNMTLLEWDMYNMLFDTISQQHTINAVIYITTSSLTSRVRIETRGRPEEENITMKYLNDLDQQHQLWLEHPGIPVLRLSTEHDSSVDTNIQLIKEFIKDISSSY